MQAIDSPRAGWWRGTVGVLGAALLFNLGQGLLRPTTPLYLQHVLAANYRMVTANEGRELMATAPDPVMVVTAHPDDPEFGAGGTIAKLVREGREVTYVIVTSGNKGSADHTITPEQLARVREEEQRSAARALGVARVEFLGYEDGEVEDTRRLRLDITRQIRHWRPGLIIAQSPERTYTNFHGWHRDHRITGGVVLDCIYPLARDHLSFPELLPEYEAHAVKEVYLIQWEEPQLLVDISGTMDLKLHAITHHASQIGDFRALETRLRQRFAALGAGKGYAYAEGFDRVVLR